MIRRPKITPYNLSNIIYPQEAEGGGVGGSRILLQCPRDNITLSISTRLLHAICH